MSKCTRCSGHGKYITTDPYSGSMFAKPQDVYETDCWNCNGTGIVGDEAYKLYMENENKKADEDIEKIKASSMDEMHKKYLINLRNMLAGRWTPPIQKMYDELKELK